MCLVYSECIKVADWLGCWSLGLPMGLHVNDQPPAGVRSALFFDANGGVMNRLAIQSGSLPLLLFNKKKQEVDVKF